MIVLDLALDVSDLLASALRLLRKLVRFSDPELADICTYMIQENGRSHAYARIKKWAYYQTNIVWVISLFWYGRLPKVRIQPRQGDLYRLIGCWHPSIWQLVRYSLLLKQLYGQAEKAAEERRRLKDIRYLEQLEEAYYGEE